MARAGRLRVRLALRALLAAAFGAGVLLVAAEFALVRPVESRDDVRLVSLAEGLAEQVGARGLAEFRAAAPSWVAPERREWAALRGVDGAVIATEGDVAGDAVLAARPGSVVVAEGLRPGGYRVAASAVAAAPGSPVVVVGFPREPLREEQMRLRTYLGGAAGLAVLLVAAGAWLGAGAVLAPLRRLTDAAGAEQVAGAGPPRLPVRDPRDEFDDLAVVLNALWGRLDEALTEERRFASEAAHELRAPLAVLRLRVDRAVADGSPAALRSALEEIREDSDRLGRLVQVLLESSRAADAVTATGTGPALAVDAAETCRGLAADFAAVAEAAGRRFEAAVPLVAVPVAAPREVVESCVSVMVDNALRYSPPESLVRLVLEPEEAGGARVAVSDGGPGVDADEALRVFDRLFRGSAGRAAGGGFGLGLSLARRLARASGGDVTLENPGVPGARFLLRLPGPRPDGTAS